MHADPLPMLTSRRTLYAFGRDRQVRDGTEAEEGLWCGPNITHVGAQEFIRNMSMCVQGSSRMCVRGKHAFRRASAFLHMLIFLPHVLALIRAFVHLAKARSQYKQSQHAKGTAGLAGTSLPRVRTAAIRLHSLPRPVFMLPELTPSAGNLSLILSNTGSAQL